MNMKETPLISVIIPAYNHEKYIEDCIESIINQSYENIELLIVDDGSEDSTYQKIYELEERCKKRFIRYIFKTQKNIGTGETLNVLLNLVEGEYVYLIASDDLAKPQAIERLYTFLSVNSEYALAVGDNELIDDNDKVVFWDKDRKNVNSEKDAIFKTFGAFLRAYRKDVNFLSDNFGSYSSLLNGNYIPNGYMFRKSIFEQTGYYKKEAPLEDYYMALQIAKYAKMKFLDEILFSYRWHSDNISKQEAKIKIFTRKTVYYEKQIVENSNNKEIKEIFFTVKRYKKFFIRIPYVVSLYRDKYYEGESLYLTIFGKIFLLRRTLY